MKLVILAMSTLSGSFSNSYGPTFIPLCSACGHPNVPRTTGPSWTIRGSCANPSCLTLGSHHGQEGKTQSWLSPLLGCVPGAFSSKGTAPRWKKRCALAGHRPGTEINLLVQQVQRGPVFSENGYKNFNMFINVAFYTKRLFNCWLQM